MGITDALLNLPEVKAPTQKRLPFKEKLKWTAIILFSFFILSLIPLYGLGQNALLHFEQLSILLGAKFGSLLSLGIGPLVTASIILQLLTGSGILKLDMTTSEGKKRFQALSKLLSIFFIVFEAFIYVFLGGLSPSATLAPEIFRIMQILLIVQLIVGGLLIMLMDDLVQKWGFGSGISLFIAAGVSQQIMIRAFSPLTTAGTFAIGTTLAPVGKVWVFFQSIIGRTPSGALLALSSILATVIIFAMSVYGQAMKVEIPLSFGRVRGYGIRWPLKFIYTSNIPVILIAALLANIQLWAKLLESKGIAFLGTFTAQGAPASGFITWVYPPQLINSIITGSFQWLDISHAASYMGFMVIGSIIFSYFWVQTSGMDARSQAKQIMSSGLQIPGFRRDERILEHLLKRYITPLTIMGGALVGLLAATADLLGALSRGTGILLAVMIIYKLYEDIAREHMLDMHPALRKMMGK
ncbi:MAG: preprotein translocase subunit SecY [Nanoarchaeota archaeon]|nr:preprotein translocase subunit SecY [Nanoarchaeota archaeon]